MARLVSLNMEGDKHLALVEPFLQRRKPDILCLQEVREPTLERFKQQFGMEGAFAPMTRHAEEEGAPLSGVALLSTDAVGDVSKQYYFGSPALGDFVRGDNDTVSRVLVTAETHGYRVGTTHFVVTQEGRASEEQKQDLVRFLGAVKAYDEIVFCGDFNAPRGGEVFSRIAELYKDNIPSEYKTSIDGDIHRAGSIPFMVDGLFTTPGYEVKSSELVCGVSDHCAIVSELA